MSAKIEEGFGPNGLGILSIADVHNILCCKPPLFYLLDIDCASYGFYAWKFLHLFAELCSYCVLLFFLYQFKSSSCSCLFFSLTDFVIGSWVFIIASKPSPSFTSVWDAAWNVYTLVERAKITYTKEMFRISKFVSLYQISRPSRWSEEGPRRPW